MVEYIGNDGTKFIVGSKIYVNYRSQQFYLLLEEYRDDESADFIRWLIETKKVNDMPSLRRRIKGRMYLEHTSFMPKGMS